MTETLAELFRRVEACRICEAHLPLGPRPIVRGKETARILIIGQAPGTKVHESGIPWNDPSGDRLRDWLNIDKTLFYDQSRIAIMPMGFCYPGRDPKGGDMPPRPECAPEWHDLIRPLLPQVELTMLVGSYAQNYYLGKNPVIGNEKRKTMTEVVRQFAAVLERGFFPTPHPSWRTGIWQKKNPWYEAEVLPELRCRVSILL